MDVSSTLITLWKFSYTSPRNSFESHWHGRQLYVDLTIVSLFMMQQQARRVWSLGLSPRWQDNLDFWECKGCLWHQRYHSTRRVYRRYHRRKQQIRNSLCLLERKVLSELKSALSDDLSWVPHAVSHHFIFYELLESTDHKLRENKSYPASHIKTTINHMTQLLNDVRRWDSRKQAN